MPGLFLVGPLKSLALVEMRHHRQYAVFFVLKNSLTNYSVDLLFHNDIASSAVFHVALYQRPCSKVGMLTKSKFANYSTVYYR